MADNISGNPASEKSSGNGLFYGRIRFWIMLAIIMVVTLYGLIFFIQSPGVADQGKDQELLSHALTVTTLTLRQTGHYQVKQKYSGLITARQQSDYGFDTGGILAQVQVDEGDQVRKGDILARLDRRRLDARARELKAEIARSIALNRETEARLDRARATYNRYRELVANKNISNQRFDQSKFDLLALKAHKISTEAAVTAARAALNSLRTAQNMTLLKARYNGSVTRRYLDEGAAVTAGTPVIRLIEDRKLEIHVGLPPLARSSFTIGKPYIFDYPGGRITADLRTVLKIVDQNTRTITAIFDIKDYKSDIHPGALAQLTVTSDIKQAGFWIPTGALSESRRGLWSVYTLKSYRGSQQYGTLSRQELQLLYTGSKRVYVRGTLQDGDRIVTSGLQRLVPGQLVRKRSNSD